MSGIDTYTKLLLHCNGTDASTTFTDVMGKTVSPVNQAQIDTAQSKFGGSSALFDGTTDALTTPFVTDFDVAAGAFTVDFWFRTSSAATTQGLFYYKQADNSDYHGIGIIMIGGKLYYGASSNGTSWNLLIVDTGATDVGSHTLLSDTWYHIEFGRNGNNWYGFVNGEADFTKTVAGTVIACDDKFQIGAWVSYAASVVGWIDEFRFSKGICRHTAIFTPPTIEYYRSNSGILMNLAGNFKNN